jgi:hypothetical protein
MISGVIALMLWGRFWFHLNPSSRLACHGLITDRHFCLTSDDLNDRRHWGDVFFEAVANSWDQSGQKVYWFSVSCENGVRV